MAMFNKGVTLGQLDRLEDAIGALFGLVGEPGFEPGPFPIPSGRAARHVLFPLFPPLVIWSGSRDLNPGPPAPKAGALPDCATPRRTSHT